MSSNVSRPKFTLHTKALVMQANSGLSQFGLLGSNYQHVNETPQILNSVNFSQQLLEMPGGKRQSKYNHNNIASQQYRVRFLSHVLEQNALNISNQLQINSNGRNSNSNQRKSYVFHPNSTTNQGNLDFKKSQQQMNIFSFNSQNDNSNVNLLKENNNDNLRQNSNKLYINDQINHLNNGLNNFNMRKSSVGNILQQHSPGKNIHDLQEGDSGGGFAMPNIFKPNMPTSKFKNFDNEMGDILNNTTNIVSRKSSQLTLSLLNSNNPTKASLLNIKNRNNMMRDSNASASTQNNDNNANYDEDSMNFHNMSNNGGGMIGNYNNIKQYLEQKQRRSLICVDYSKENRKLHLLSKLIHQLENIQLFIQDDKYNEIVNDQTMNYFIKKCFSGDTTPKKIPKYHKQQLNFESVVNPDHQNQDVKINQELKKDDTAKSIFHRQRNSANSVSCDQQNFSNQAAQLLFCKPRQEIEDVLHHQLTKYHYPQLFTRNFRAKNLDSSYERLSIIQRNKLLEGFITFLDKDLMELRDENEVHRKDFIRKMQEEKQRQIYKKRDPSPSDVLVPFKELRKRRINQSSSLLAVKRKTKMYFAQRDLSFDEKLLDKNHDDGRITNHRAKAIIKPQYSKLFNQMLVMYLNMEIIIIIFIIIL